MIKHIRDKSTLAVFRRQFARKLPDDIQQRAKQLLDVLDAATSLDELRLPPSNKLERLKGRRSDLHSLRINKQWRIVFRWDDGDAWDVEITDYH